MSQPDAYKYEGDGSDLLLPRHGRHQGEDERDQRDSAYSSEAAEIIGAAYSAIRATDFDTAETLIQPWIGVLIAPMQRARILYIRALIASHRGNNRETLHVVDEALEIVLTLEELAQSLLSRDSAR